MPVIEAQAADGPLAGRGIVFNDAAQSVMVVRLPSGAIVPHYAIESEPRGERLGSYRLDNGAALWSDIP